MLFLSLDETFLNSIGLSFLAIVINVANVNLSPLYFLYSFHFFLQLSGSYFFDNCEYSRNKFSDPPSLNIIEPNLNQSSYSSHLFLSTQFRYDLNLWSSQDPSGSSIDISSISSSSSIFIVFLIFFFFFIVISLFFIFLTSSSYK